VRQAIVRFVAFAKSRGAINTKLSTGGGHRTVIAFCGIDSLTRGSGADEGVRPP
jgi:hypothetical protein